MSFFNPFVGESGSSSSETIDLSEYAKKEDLVGQKTAEGGEIFNDYGNNMMGGHRLSVLHREQGKRLVLSC